MKFKKLSDLPSLGCKFEMLSRCWITVSPGNEIKVASTEGRDGTKINGTD